MPPGDAGVLRAVAHDALRTIVFAVAVTPLPQYKRTNWMSLPKRQCDRASFRNWPGGCRIPSRTDEVAIITVSGGCGAKVYVRRRAGRTRRGKPQTFSRSRFALTNPAMRRNARSTIARPVLKRDADLGDIARESIRLHRPLNIKGGDGDEGKVHKVRLARRFSRRWKTDARAKAC